MPEQSYDENELGRIYCWWWRRKCDFREYDLATHTIRIPASAKNHPEARGWKANVEASAWRYELARRHDRTSTFLPFPDEEESIRSGLEDTGSLTKVYRFNDLPFSQDLEIWDDERNWTEVLNVQWNLTASNQELTENFIRLIEEERRAHGRLRPKAKGPHGKRNRPLSWRWPELLDRVHYVHTPRLEGNERSILSQARKAASYYHQLLWAYLSRE